MNNIVGVLAQQLLFFFFLNFEVSIIFLFFSFIFVERENSRLITSWHVTLPSPQDTTNYKAPHIAARFCYHYSETNRNLPSVMQEPITPQHV